MITMLHLRVSIASLFVLLLASLLLDAPSVDLAAQPTYKLDVKPHLKPLAAIKLADGKISRTDLDDDPGFRLQYHIKQLDGKSVSTIEARSNPSVAIPTAAAGSYTIVLELFYPAYKGGTSQKGEFKEVSNVIAYKVDNGKISPIELRRQKNRQNPRPRTRNNACQLDDSARLNDSSQGRNDAAVCRRI